MKFIQHLNGKKVGHPPYFKSIALACFGIVTSIVFASSFATFFSLFFVFIIYLYVYVRVL